MKLRACDGNGHVPAESLRDTLASTSRESHEQLMNPDLFDRQLAETRARFAQAQADLASNVIKIAFELGRLRGIVEERNRQEAAG